MKLAWMGRQRELIDALFQWGNYYASIRNSAIDFMAGSGIRLSPAEMQVIEYLLENEELKLNMAGVARRLGVSPSAFTQVVSRLGRQGLVEKYYLGSNRKDMIVMVTERGKQVYDIYAQRLLEEWKDEVLAPLEAIPEEYQKLFAQALRNVFRVQKEIPQPPLIPARKGAKG